MYFPSKDTLPASQSIDGVPAVKQGFCVGEAGCTHVLRPSVGLMTTCVSGGVRLTGRAAIDRARITVRPLATTGLPWIAQPARGKSRPQTPTLTIELTTPSAGGWTRQLGSASLA